MHIVCVCGLGMGSSLILKMTVDKALKELNVTGHDIEHWDAGTVDSRNADLIVTSADFESRQRDLCKKRGQHGGGERAIESLSGGKSAPVMASFHHLYKEGKEKIWQF